jgi:hypothetical protein
MRPFCQEIPTNALQHLGVLRNRNWRVIGSHLRGTPVTLTLLFLGEWHVSGLQVMEIRNKHDSEPLSDASALDVG